MSMFSLVQYKCLSILTLSTTYFGEEEWDLDSMAALLGRVEQIDPKQEEWPQLVERLEQFFEANDITEYEKAETYILIDRPLLYKLLQSLIRRTVKTPIKATLFYN